MIATILVASKPLLAVIGDTCPDWVPEWICWAIRQRTPDLGLVVIATIGIAASYRALVRHHA